jgi:hypothetical protein
MSSSFSFIKLVLLVFLQEVLSSVPVRCLESTTALSIIEPCNRKTTCQLICKDGTKYYYDLKNIPDYKNQYTQYCKSENPTEWKTATIKRLSAMHSFNPFQSSIESKFTSKMNEIFKKFADICHGGAQVSNKEVEDEKKKMLLQMS